MANRNKSTGLRFLWIPGRKKHQHKGRYETTNLQPNYGRPQNKPNEPWSLGGSKGHSELTKGESDLEGVSAASCTTALALPAASTVAAAATTAEFENQKNAPSKEVDPRGAKSPPDCELAKTPETHFGPEDEGAAMYPPDMHNTETLLISDRKNGAIRKKIPHSSSGGDDSPALSDVFTASPSLSPIIAFSNSSIESESSPLIQPSPPPVPTSSPPPLEESHPLSTFHEHTNINDVEYATVIRHCTTTLQALPRLPSVPFNDLKHWSNQNSSPLPPILWKQIERSDNNNSDSSLNLPCIPWDRIEQRGNSATSTEFLDVNTKNELSHLQSHRGNLDSIDRMDDDCVDAIKLRNGSSANNTKHKGPVDDNEHDKTVTCLYYTLQCCECTIS